MVNKVNNKETNTLLQIETGNLATMREEEWMGKKKEIKEVRNPKRRGLQGTKFNQDERNKRGHRTKMSTLPKQSKENDRLSDQQPEEINSN